MGKIYYIMGKSATGKDTIYSKLNEECPKTKKVILYTTRPARAEEEDGIDYHFVKEEKIDEFEKNNKLIEKRIYNTRYGKWIYATIDDGQINLESRNYLIIGTLESYKKIKKYFGADKVFPIYLSVADSIRLQRALNREIMQEIPRYDEMCRRYLADEEDFSKEKLSEAGINKIYINENLRLCLDEIKSDMELL